MWRYYVYLSLKMTIKIKVFKLKASHTPARDALSLVQPREHLWDSNQTTQI